jgi:hypothetical protein
MSQSDYIRYKRVSARLQDLSSNPTNTPSIISQSDYTDFTNYTITNTVINTNKNYNELLPPDTTQIFNITVPNPTSCWTYPLCVDTNNRPNRIHPTWTDVSNNLRNIIPILPQKYVKHPPVYKRSTLLCLNNKNGSLFANPTYKVYPILKNSSNTRENATFNTNTTAYGNRRLNQLTNNKCANTCPSTI